MVDKISFARHFFNLALKNLLLYKQRTILTFLILSFGIMFYIVLDGMLVGMTDESVKTLIDMKTGDIQIYARDYDRDEIFTVYPIGDDRVETVLNEDKNIVSYIKRIHFTAMIEGTYSMMPAMVYGIDYNEDVKVLNTLKFVETKRSREMLSSGDIPYAFIGYKLAEQMETGEGDWILLSFRTKRGMLNSMFMEIGGIIRSPETSLNSSTVIVPYAEALKALMIERPTQYIVKTVNYANAKKYRDILRNKMALTVNYWMDEGREFLEISRMKQRNSSVFIVFVLIIAVISIVNTMIMSVYEKIREIGTMKALGFYDREISFVFTFEGLLIGFFGSLFGVILGAFMNWYLVVKGIDFSKLMGSEVLGMMGFNEIMHSSWNIATYIGSIVAGTMLSYLATLSSAKRAARLDPAKALRTI